MKTLLLYSCLQYKALIHHCQITHDLFFNLKTGYIMATLLQGIFFSAAVILWLFSAPSRLLPAHAVIPAAVFLVLKAGIMQPPFSYLIVPVMQPRILLPLTLYFTLADTSMTSKSSPDFWLAGVEIPFW